MKSIKIVKAPNSSDPESRRLQLVGLVIPFLSDEALTVHNLNPEANTHVVLTKNVIGRLNNERKKSAVEYWSSKGALFMTFKADECRIIS